MYHLQHLWKVPQMRRGGGGSNVLNSVTMTEMTRIYHESLQPPQEFWDLLDHGAFSEAVGERQVAEDTAPPTPNSAPSTLSRRLSTLTPNP